MPDLRETLTVALTTSVVGWLVWWSFRKFMAGYLAWRRRSPSGREWQDYKAKLPAWVKQIELAMWASIWLALIFLWLRSARLWHAQPLNDTRFGVYLFAGLFGLLPPAMLLANLISYAVPPLRRANLQSFEGFQTTSFAAANRGLLKVGAFFTLPALAVAAGAVFWPG
jgi:hypothetical protein